MFHKFLYLAGLLVGATAGLATGQTPDPGEYSEPKYEIVERRGVRVAMRDDVRLAVDIYMPKTSEKLPIILSIIPYGPDFAEAKARWFAKRGYVFVTADSRGRFRSGGTWDPFDSRHKTDGYDLVEWLAQQSYSNGKVGMWGPSFMGWAQWWTASTAPPHLTTIVPWTAPGDAFDDLPYRGGAIVGPWMDWAAVMAGRTPQARKAPSDGGSAEQDYQHTPYIDINAFRGLKTASWFLEWYRQNKPTDPYWKGIAYQAEEHYSKIAVPSLSITGWFDSTFLGSPTNYLGMKRFGATPAARRPSLIMGPWVHAVIDRTAGGIDYGPEAQLDIDGYSIRWFDHFLKGIDNGVQNDPPVYVFVMGENKWHAEQDWPLPQAKPTKFYLLSNGHANSLKGDGVLTTSPSPFEAADTYSYDPRIPTADCYNLQIEGACDTRSSAAGDEVLVYQTPPLQAPLEVTGPIEATLYAATSARDTDWMVRLVDVQPDGQALLLADGVMRARNRDPNDDGRFNAAQLSTIEPGKVYPYTLRFWRGTANLFQTGHRIRLEISSSWFPFFLPNLNTGADNVARVSRSHAVVAQQTVHHGPQFRSHLVLPVVPPRSATP